MEYNKIDTSILPKAWLHWETTKDKFWLNCETNERQNFKPDIDFGWRNKSQVLYNSGSNPIWAYAKYHKDIDMLELAGVTFDTRRTADSHEWKYAGNRYFIDRNKSVFNENGTFASCYTLSDHHYAYNVKNFLQMYCRLSATPEVMVEFRKFIGADFFTNGSGKCIEAQYTYNILEWYIRKQKSAETSKGKAQKLTNELTSIPLTDISGFGAKYQPVVDYNGYYNNTIRNIIYFERVDDKWSVLRVLNRISDDKFIEAERFYINDNGTNRIVTPTKDGWMPTKQNQDWKSHIFVNQDEAIEKCNRLKYILQVIDGNDKKIKKLLFNALRFPEIEQLIKLGYKKDALSFASSYTPKADIKYKFGYYNEKGKTLLNRVGMTKHQLDKHLYKEESSISYSHYNNHYSGTHDLITTVREFFGDDFIHLDNATFDKYYDAFDTILSRCGTRFQRNFERINVDKKRFIKNMVRLGEKNEQVYQVICDTVSTYLHLDRDTAPEIDWYFGSYSDVTRAHDAFVEMDVMQQAERRARWDAAEKERIQKEEEKRIKLDEERQKYEFEDDDFIIRLPKTGAEITREGVVQHICIGSYVGTHSRGETNLFFLRKKSVPDMAFYAIEMTNAKTINQIHGFGNKWLGNNPEAIPTVVRWLRKNGIKCDTKILTCTAIGYSSIDNYVQMPVVD